MIRNILGLAVLLGLVGLVAYVATTDREKFAVLANVSKGDIALVSLGCLGFIATQGFILQLACRPFGVQLSAVEGFGLVCVSFFINFLVPFLGVGARGAYLLKRHALGVVDYGTVLVGILAIELAVYAVGGLSGQAILWRAGYQPDALIALVFLAAVGGATLASVFPLHHLPGGYPALDRGKAVLQRAQTLIGSRDVAPPIILWTALQFASFTLAFWAAFHAIGADVPVPGAQVTAALSNFSFLVRLAPAAAGSFEVAVYYASTLFSIPFAQTLIIALLVRLGLLIVFLPTGPVFFWLLLKRTKVI
jgi:uncharacterized membrane protein YbhN (UPF0104 family)